MSGEGTPKYNPAPEIEEYEAIGKLQEEKALLRVAFIPPIRFFVATQNDSLVEFGTNKYISQPLKDPTLYLPCIQGRGLRYQAYAFTDLWWG